jgi:type I restriction-modification system DNA methylase subunit
MRQSIYKSWHNASQRREGTVILPLTVMRRLDCVLEPKKEDVLVI